MKRKWHKLHLCTKPTELAEEDICHFKGTEGLEQQMLLRCCSGVLMTNQNVSDIRILTL